MTRGGLVFRSCRRSGSARFFLSLSQIGPQFLGQSRSTRSGSGLGTGQLFAGFSHDSCATNTKVRNAVCLARRACWTPEQPANQLSPPATDRVSTSVSPIRDVL